ncbi:acyl-CoA dehydrogenase family protein [Desulfatibacillum aliphaticivorans]|uniref:acyl-CoA dehydrogenase family protein n=1 Tax=Desulfatibacillum aliphaticivorans TaxID=218208 RepID=UPI00042203AF|nr:acyl-CoA dehydrogenase family protein [Desulfatibacillum aliphaticivorans]
MDILNYTDGHKAFRQRLQEFCKQEIIPHVDQWEKDGVTPREIWKKMGAEGFLCTWVDEKYGGLGGDFLYSVIALEELVRTNQYGLDAFLHSDIVTPYIASFGNEEQREKYLPGCVSGECITAVAMSEPDAGSDLASMTMTALDDGDHVVLNGTKTFISNGLLCDVAVVAAIDPEESNRHHAVSLFLVDEGTPGFEKGKAMKKMGASSQDTAELFFRDCRIPQSNRLGEKGSGFPKLMVKLQQERLLVALNAVTRAEFVLEWTTKYCRENKSEGKPRSKFQAVQFALVEMATETRLGRAFLDKLIAGHMAGEDVNAETCMAKYWATDMAKRTANRCLDLVGLDATAESCPLARMFRDIRVFPIFAGTNEVMKIVVSRSLGLG